MSALPDPLLHWLVRTTVEGGLLVVLVLALRWACAVYLSPPWRVGLWIVVGFKLVVPASLPLGMGFGTLFSARAEVARESLVADSKESERPRSEIFAGGGGAPTPWSNSTTPRLASVLVGLWGLGMAGVFTTLLVREARFRRSLRGLRVCEDRELLALVRECSVLGNMKSMPTVRLLPQRCGPALAGLFAPVLLLPADWRERFDRDALRHVIFHELEHVRSRDLVWNWLAALLTAVHWFNPLVWLAASRFQADRELRCDARALRRMGPAERIAYGRTLLRISEHFLAPPAIAGLAPCVRKHPALRHRITMITRPPTATPALQLLSAGALGLLVCLSFGSARAEEEPGKDRTREGQRSREAQEAKSGAREGERPREGGEKMREGDGQKPRAREGDGERPRTAERDGERPKSGARDGERPRSGERDGERPKSGLRDGEGGRGREGEKMRDGEGSAGQPIEIRVLGDGGEVRIAERTVPLNQLRGFLSGYLVDKAGRPVVIDADAATPFAAVGKVLDAARDSGAKNAQIRPAKER